MTDAANRPYSRTLLFAGRTAREILRDPLSFVFCLALPVVMLVGMHLLFADGAPVVFSLEVLTPGIAVFSNAFIMLFMTMLASRDRSTAFLCRLYTSPMRTVDFVGGYALPGLVIGVAQLVACYLAAILLGLITGATTWINLSGILLAMASALPMLVAYVAVGILFGCLFSDKAAPGLSSVIISGGGFVSGAWMPLETLAPGFRAFCRALPFYPSVRAGRALLNHAVTDSADLALSIAVPTAYAVLLSVAVLLVFRFKTRREGE